MQLERQAFSRLEAELAAGNPHTAAAEIYIYGDIGESWSDVTVSACDFVQQFDALNVSYITIRMSSYGGSVPDRIAIHSAIRRHRAHVTIVMEGVAASLWGCHSACRAPQRRLRAGSVVPRRPQE